MTLLVETLASAWQGRVLESGEFGSLAELAAAEQISRSYVSRVLRLTLLVPDFVERIFGGQPTAGLAQFLKPLPVSGSRSASSSVGSAPDAHEQPYS